MEKKRKNASMEDVQNALLNLAHIQEQNEKARRKSEERLQKSFERVNQAQQKTEEAQQRTEKAQQRTEEAQQRTEESRKEGEENLRKSIEELNRFYGGLSRGWGDMVEKLIAGGLKNILAKWKIKVQRVQPNFQFLDGEFDLVTINGKEMVIIEVKTFLRKKDVDHFLKQLDKYMNNPPDEYRDKIIYAGVGFLNASKEAIIHAEEKGLFVIKGLGGENSVSKIINSKGFRPRKI